MGIRLAFSANRKSSRQGRKPYGLRYEPNTIVVVVSVENAYWPTMLQEDRKRMYHVKNAVDRSDANVNMLLFCHRYSQSGI